MPRDHFAQMYQNKSHRHDTPHDSYGFDEVVGTICGMLYSVITLKCFFPSSPAKTMNNNPAKNVKAEGHEYTQLTLF